MARSKRIGLDTSVVLRLIVGEPAVQAARATQFLSEATVAGHALVVSDLVVCETYFALHTHYDVPKRRAVATLIQMLTEGPVAAAEDSAVLGALKATAEGGQKLGFVDRLIHAQFASTGAEMVSFEKAARRLERTQVL